MNDQIAQNSIEMLCADWQKLKRSLYECDEIRLEVFQDIFQKTEQCLRQCIGANAISKAYIPLIADAYAFVDAESGDANVQIQAAKILTERMLYQYAVNVDANEQNASCVTIYLLKTKRQLTVDFSNVAAAFSVLTDALQL